MVTIPSDADVLLADEPIERNDDGRFLLPIGSNQLMIRREGYEPATLTINVSEDSKTVDVPPLRTRVSIDTTPEDAEVFLGETRLVPTESSKNQYLLPVGKNTLVVRKEGYIEDKREQVVERGSKFLIELQEVPKPVVDEPTVTKPKVQVTPTSSIGMDLVWCKPNHFAMGSPDSEGEPNEHGADGKAVKTVISKGFWIGKTEVTQEQWIAVMATEPWREIGDNAIIADDLPANYVNRDDAMTFCRKLTQIEEEKGISLI